MRYIYLLLVAALVILGLFLFVRNPENTSKHLDSIGFEYYEDSTGEMDLEKVQEKFKSGASFPIKDDSFSFGKSSSNYWIHIPLGKLDPHIYKEYISIYNPTVTKAILYLPVWEKDILLYKELSSGWHFGEAKQDEGFFYPVFHWDENTDFERDAYVQLYSRFTQNYGINFLSYQEFEQIKRNDLMLYGILFGILLAGAIKNFIIFLELKDKANLYYFFYILAMVFYQGNLCGIYNVFIPRYSNLIMANTITLSLIAMSTVIIFFRAFLKTKECFLTYDRMLKGLLLFVFAGAIFLIANQSVLANLYSHSISNIGSIIMMFIAFQAHKKGFEQARLFILGWVFMFFSLGISLLRHAGWIPNNAITIHITFIAVAIQSILISTALVKMIKALTKEKENALRQYKDAEENAQCHEIAFLHAQIKPHFLYNALNVISSLCRIDSEKARELLLDLADFLRYTFDFRKDQKMVSLKEELEYVQAYVRIEQARFRNKLNVIYELEETTELKIPPLILQPLVENAIIHGIRKRNGIGSIVLRVKEEDSDFIIEIEDKGLGMTRGKIECILSDNWYKGKGVGVFNINKRLIKLYGEGLYIKSILEEGTLISFKVPKGDENHAKSYIDR